MTKLKTINLNDLGVKEKRTSPLDFEKFANYSKAERRMSFENELETPYAEAKMFEKTYHNNNSSSMNSKFLKYLNFIESAKNKPNQYFDKRTEQEKDLEPEEFTPSSPPTKTLPLTFRKFFYQTFPKNITEFALKNPEKLPNLITEIRNDIQKEASTWLDFVADKQVSSLICQIGNYSEKAKIYKKSSDFQNIAEVIQWIIDTNLKTYYPSSDWNKGGAITFSEKQENLLIIDSLLFQRIEIAEEWESRQEEEKRKIPLPLHEVWRKFASLIVFPLKNNFQFIIINKKALVGWKDFQNLEVKYDEDNSTTYFIRKMEGGFEQLTGYNAVAFIAES